MINILIRTSDRPEYFNRCIGSIRNQTCSNYQILVSAPNENTARYVRAAGIEPVMVHELQRDAKNTFPWNLYLNTLMQEVTEGWILILDDDDQLNDENSIEILSGCLSLSKETLIVYRMQFPDGRIIPDTGYFGQTPFVRKHIGMPCFCFHSKYCKTTQFDGQRAGDYRFVNELLKKVKSVHWLDQVLVKLSNYGLNGAKTDLQNEINNKIMKQKTLTINPLKGKDFRHVIFNHILSGIEKSTLVDLGAGHCSFSLVAHRQGFKVTAVDARTSRVPVDLPLDIEFIRADAIKYDVSKFDVVCILGLLYHLNIEEQINLLNNCRGKLTIIDTHLAKSAEVTEKGYEGAYYREAVDKAAMAKNPKASFTTLRSFWHTYESFYRLIKEMGYSEVTTVVPEHYPYRTFFICAP